MDTLAAYGRNKMAQQAEAETMVFDWDKAALLIKEKRPQEACAGLRDDWEWTGGSIYRAGSPIPREETDTFLASRWAVPELKMDGVVVWPVA